MKLPSNRAKHLRQTAGIRRPPMSQARKEDRFLHRISDRWGIYQVASGARAKTLRADYGIGFTQLGKGKAVYVPEKGGPFELVARDKTTHTPSGRVISPRQKGWKAFKKKRM